MRRILFGIVAFGLLASPARAQEKITLTAPESVTNNDYRRTKFIVADDDPNTVADETAIIIEFKGVTSGEMVVCKYDATTTPTGKVLSDGLNKANLSLAYAGNATTGTLRQRTNYRLAILGEAVAVCSGKSLAGSLTGSVP